MVVLHSLEAVLWVVILTSLAVISVSIAYVVVKVLFLSGNTKNEGRELTPCRN